MAKTARGYRDAGHPDSVLNAKVIRALHAWTSLDYQNPNWWWNEIGLPELIGEIASLMQPQLSPDELARVGEIMKRSNWRRVPWKVAEYSKITASNPENKSLVLNVEIETHGAAIDLPGGNFADSSISSMLNAI